MKLFLMFILVQSSVLTVSTSAFADQAVAYSCFTDGYEPGMTVDFSFDKGGNLIEFKTFIRMPDGSNSNVKYYGANVPTLAKLVDGKVAFTGWDFSQAPAPESTVIVEQDFKSGVLISRTEKEPLPSIVSISCSKIK